MKLATAAQMGDKGYIEAEYDPDTETGHAFVIINGNKTELYNNEPGEGSGILSISISPVLTTTPALDSVFPIYWDDLTDEEKENGVNVALTVPSHDPFESYYITVTPTPDWYAFDPSNMETSGKGEPVTYQLIIGEEGNMCMVASSTEMPPEMGVLVNLTVEDE